jgi:hypothetical protein
MSDDGNVLPQAEIDAIFKQATGRSLVEPVASKQGNSSTVSSGTRPKESPKVKDKPPESTPPRPSSSSKADSAKPIDTEKLDEIMATLGKLTQRIENLEEKITTLSQSKPDTTDNSDLERQLLQKVKNEEINLHKVNKRINNIITMLKGTPGYGVRDNYTCNNCGSHGFIAIPVKCSSCGTQGWLGWWPE